MTSWAAAHAWRTPRLLPMDDWRPSYRAAEQRDQLAPPHGHAFDAGIHTLPYRQKAVLCITAFWHIRLPQWVQNENPPCPGLCQFPPAADIAVRIGSPVPQSFLALAG